MLFRYAFAAFVLFISINVSVFAKIDANPVEKTLLFAVGIIFLATRKIRWEILVMIALVLMATLLSASLSSYYALSFSRYIRSAFSLTATFLLLAAEPTESDKKLMIRLLSVMPIIMVVFGIVYQAVGLRPLFYTDFLGASRLQGSSIPAGLGTAGYLGAIAAMLGAALIDKRKYLVIAFIDLIILVLSAARMPLALSVALCAYIYFTMVNRSMITRIASLGTLVPAAAIFVMFFGEALMARFESESLSGRDLIWAALERTLDAYPTFGIGLGHQILVIPPDVAFLAKTIAAHNEYLRIAVETGYVGAISIFALLILMCIATWRRSVGPKNLTFILMCASFFIYCRTDNAISSTSTPLILMLASFTFTSRRILTRPVSLGRPNAPVRRFTIHEPQTN